MTEAVEEREVELDLLRGLPQERPRLQWLAIIAASLFIHLILFTAAIRLRSFAVHNLPERHRVIVRYTPLYLPPDLMTQKAPNRQKLSKNIDLADLLAAPAQQERRAAPRPSVKRFELPKQTLPLQASKVPPQIMPEVPQIAVDQTSGPPPGMLGQLPPTPAPAQKESPFQSIGSEAPPNPHPTLKPPSAGVQSAISNLATNASGRHLVISDDNSSEPMPGSPGALGNTGGNHASVELQSDPQGADFKPYLTRILAIVRANWRHVIPESARMGALRGRTTLEFVIDRDGKIPKLVLADSSGSEPLDRAAVAGLSMSNPLPPLPSDYKGFQVRLAFSFSYSMPSQ